MGLLSFLDPPRKPRRHRVLLTVKQTQKYARLSTVRRKIRLAAAKRAEQLGRADTTARMHRFRQHAPAAFVKGSFRTLVFGKGIEAVAGHVKVRR